MKYVAIIEYNEEGFPVDMIEVKAVNKTEALFLLAFCNIKFLDFWTMIEEHGTKEGHQGQASDH